MAHKNITISAEAYEALARLKKERESFTDVILRVAAEKTGAAALLRAVKAIAPDNELAEKVESSSVRLRGTKLRRPEIKGNGD